MAVEVIHSLHKDRSKERCWIRQILDVGADIFGRGSLSATEQRASQPAGTQKKQGKVWNPLLASYPVHALYVASEQQLSLD